MLQMFYLKVIKIDTVLHMLQWPQLLGCCVCAWEAEGWSAVRWRAREAEADGGRDAGVQAVHSVAGSIGRVLIMLQARWELCPDVSWD
jgi:hypothetical protein